MHITGNTGISSKFIACLRKLNKKLKALVAGTKSGFETFRRIMREEDPVTESTEYSLRFAFQQMVFQKCANLDGTRRLIQAMEKKISEYREKTGKEMDEVLKALVIHGAMDGGHTILAELESGQTAIF